MVIQLVARSARVPGIIMLLAAGVLLGPEALGWVRPADLGDGLFGVIDFAVAIILFEGALNLKIDRLRREERVIRRLITLGAVVTLAGGTFLAWTILYWPWTLSLLFGSLVVVTGPTVIGPLVRELRLQTRVRTILEAEGILIDPIGALIATLVLQVILAADTLGVVTEIGTLIWRLVIGTLAGAVGGLLIAGLLRVPALIHGFENALTLALVILLFHLSDFIAAPTGLLAVTIAGLVVGNLKSPVDHNLREFKDQLTVLMIGAVFVLLAADIELADMRALGGRGLAVLVLLVVVVRPLGVWVATRFGDLPSAEQLFISSIAPRGIVAAAIASLTAATLDARGIDGGAELRALVFLVIVGTVLAAGIAGWPLSRALHLRRPPDLPPDSPPDSPSVSPAGTPAPAPE